MSPPRVLGRTGLPVSPLGFGVTGPHASPVFSRTETIALIRQAAALGVNVFDTGPAYGDGEAESRLGEAVTDLERSALVIATKAGIPARGQRDFSPDGIAASLDASLARLGTEYVDILLLHGPNQNELTPALFDRLAQIRTTGKVRHFGLCTRGEGTEAVLEHDLFDVLMAPCHSGLGPAESGILARAHKAGIGVIGIEAMAGAKGRWHWPRNRGDLWYLARAALQTLKGPPAPPSLGNPQEAMKTALAHPHVDTVLSLTTRETHLNENAALAGLDRTLAPS